MESTVKLVGQNPHRTEIMMKAALIGFVLIFAALSHNAFGQRESKEELDRPFLEAEKRDAIQLSKLFTRRLHETQDIAPLLGEFMTRDFMEYAKQDRYFNAFVFQDEALIQKVPSALQNRFFVLPSASNFSPLQVACARN